MPTAQGDPMPPNHHHDNDELHDHDLGLSHDLPTLLNRRRALGLLSGAGLAAALAACSSDGPSAATTSSSGSATRAATTAAATGTEIPEETAGPYPGDGSNGVNVLTESGIVRSDITTSFGAASGVAEGVPLTDQAHGARHRQRLRPRWPVPPSTCGTATSDGQLLAVLPGRHERELPARRAGGRRGRHGHLHQHLPGRLRRPLAAHPLRGLPEPRRRRRAPATKLRTSQLALPEDTCNAVYATAGYEQSVAQPGPDLARHRHGVQRRLVAAARQGHRRRRHRA